METKELKDISWQVDEKTYRADPALSYSTISRYEREGGFNSLPTLFDRIETPSLLLGSIVDCIITDGEEAFNNQYMVADFPSVPDAVKKIINELFNTYSDRFDSLDAIDNDKILDVINNLGYQQNWRPETRVKVVVEKGSQYYDLMYISQDKTIVDEITYRKALSMVEALKHSKATEFYFKEDDPFDDSIKRYYQLKFKSKIDGVDFRCMMDLAVIDYRNKIIYPCDLKTSSHYEWDFPKSFIQWRYFQQAKLYSRILSDNLKKDEYFKDFKVENYRFIVVNKDSLCPLVWEYEDTFKWNEPFILPEYNRKVDDPVSIGKELRYYLDHEDVNLPVGITIDKSNKIMEWLYKDGQNNN